MYLHDPNGQNTVRVSFADDLPAIVPGNPAGAVLVATVPRSIVNVAASISGPDSALTYDNLAIVDATTVRLRLLNGTLTQTYTVKCLAGTNEQPQRVLVGRLDVLVENQ